MVAERVEEVDRRLPGRTEAERTFDRDPTREERRHELGERVRLDRERDVRVGPLHARLAFGLEKELELGLGRAEREREVERAVGCVRLVSTIGATCDERGTIEAPRLAGAMETLRGVVHGETFDPRTTTRRFTIACTDLVAALLVPELGARLRAKMPLASLRIVTIEHMMARDGLATGDVDLLVGVPPTVPTGCIAEPVYDDTLVCIVARTHPTLQRAKRLDVVTYAALPHVEIALFGEANRIVDVALARIGSARKVVVAVPHFTLAPLVVARSDAVATLGKKLATTYAKMLPLRVLGAPIPLPAIRVKQMWHVRSENDAGTSALRDLVRRALRLSPRRTRADTEPGDS